VRSRASGFSLVELTVIVAVFGVLLLILVSLEREFVRYDRTVALGFLRHPEAEAVTARVRRDVLDAAGYPSAFGSWVQSPRSLLLAAGPSFGESGKAVTVVYLFGEREVQRIVYSGERRVSNWAANGVPEYRVSSYELPDGDVAVRLQAHDRKGELIVDQILRPRIHP